MASSNNFNACARANVADLLKQATTKQRLQEKAHEKVFMELNEEIEFLSSFRPGRSESHEEEVQQLNKKCNRLSAQLNNARADFLYERKVAKAEKETLEAQVALLIRIIDAKGAKKI